MTELMNRKQAQQQVRNIRLAAEYVEQEVKSRRQEFIDRYASLFTEAAMPQVVAKINSAIGKAAEHTIIDSYDKEFYGNKFVSVITQYEAEHDELSKLAGHEHASLIFMIRFYVQRQMLNNIAENLRLAGYSTSWADSVHSYQIYVTWYDDTKAIRLSLGQI